MSICHTGYTATTIALDHIITYFVSRLHYTAQETSNLPGYLSGVDKYIAKRYNKGKTTLEQLCSIKGALEQAEARSLGE